MNQDLRYNTQRLIVDEWHSVATDNAEKYALATVVREILTENVTRSLPPAWQGAYTHERAQRWIQERDNEGVTLLVIENHSLQPVGLVLLFDPESSGHLRLGYMLAESAWGQGYASELVGGFIKWCRHNEIKSITGGVETDNIASRRVLEKNGFLALPLVENTEEQLFKWELK